MQMQASSSYSLSLLLQLNARADAPLVIGNWRLGACMVIAPTEDTAWAKIDLPLFDHGTCEILKSEDRYAATESIACIIQLRIFAVSGNHVTLTTERGHHKDTEK